MENKWAIKVKDVSMHFNLASERVDNLKEYIIRTIKRELFYRDFIAVKDISLEVYKGEVFGIVGTNGSGKSTLLKIISGILKPTEGSACVRGTIAPLIELGAGFDGDLTARENIYLNGAVLGYQKKFIDDHFSDIVDFAELWDFLDVPIKNYSSGMVARIAFAIATVMEPEILIVDEILSVGDFLFQQKCEKRITELIKKGVTVLIVSHSIEQIEKLCNRVMWIEKGEMKLIGPTWTVCTAYRNLKNTSLDVDDSFEKIVSKEKCYVCGQKEAVFKIQKEATLLREATCNSCGAPIRTSDIAKEIVHSLLGKNESISYEIKELEKFDILQFSTWGPLRSILKSSAKYTDYIEDYDILRKGNVKLPYTPNSFDLVISEDLCDHIDNVKDHFRQVARILKNEGYYIFMVPLHEKFKTKSRIGMERVYRANPLYGEGSLIKTDWGNDIDKYLIESGFSQCNMIKSHVFHDLEEITNIEDSYSEYQKIPAIEFYKYNSIIIVAQK